MNESEKADIFVPQLEGTEISDFPERHDPVELEVSFMSILWLLLSVVLRVVLLKLVKGALARRW